MKKELTRRSFLKLAGVGALAVAMSGSLTGCDVIDNLKDWIRCRQPSET